MKLHQHDLELHELQYEMDKDAGCILYIPEANAARRAYPAMNSLVICAHLCSNRLQNPQSLQHSGPHYSILDQKDTME